jgi:hypothetical protein
VTSERELAARRPARDPTPDLPDPGPPPARHPRFPDRTRADSRTGEPPAPDLIDFGRAGEPTRDPDRVVCGDALDELTALTDGALAAIYIDPPFGTGSVRRGRGHAYADPADDPEAFVTWLSPYLEHSRRVLAATGSLFVHLDYRSVHYVKVALDRLFGRDQFVNEIVWCYAVGGKSRHGFGRKHDTILWYARSRDWAFHADAVRIPRRGGSHMRVVNGVQEKNLPLSDLCWQGAGGLVDRCRDTQPLGPRAHGVALSEAGAAGRAHPAGGHRRG